MGNRLDFCCTKATKSNIQRTKSNSVGIDRSSSASTVLNMLMSSTEEHHMIKGENGLIPLNKKVWEA